MAEFNLKSGNSTPFKMMGSSSPLRGCIENPTGEGCGDFKVRGQGVKKVKQAVSNVKKKISKIFRKKTKPLTNEQKRDRYDNIESPTQPVRNRPAASRADIAEAENKAKELNIVNPYIGG